MESEDAVCPRCGTILVRGQAICPRCGKLFPGWIAACDACGASLGPEPPGFADDEAVRLLASVPEIDEAHARVLVAKGFHDFSDIVRLALPESEVRKGLHHAIARRALLADMGHPSADAEVRIPCPVCGTPWPAGADRCAVCGSVAAKDGALDAIREELAEVADDLADQTPAEDAAGIAEEPRTDLFDTLMRVDPDAILRDECRRQIEAWRSKGFNVAPLEDLLEDDLEAFRARSVRLIRAQMLKKREGSGFRCPLCETPLAPEAETCDNCGARFA